MMFIYVSLMLWIASCSTQAKKHHPYLNNNHNVITYAGKKLIQNQAVNPYYSQSTIKNITSSTSKRMDLPSIASLIGSETKDGTEYELLGCKLTASKDDCKYTFVPKTPECKEKLSLSKVFNSLFSEQGKLQEVMKKFVPIMIYNIEKFELDKCKGEIEFEAKARESFDLVKNRLRVKDGVIKIALNYKEFNFEKFGIDVSGNLEIGGKPVPITFVKKKNSLEGKFSVSASELKVEDFKAALTKKQIEDENDESGSEKESKPKIGLFTNAVIKKPQVTGMRDTKGFFEIVMSGQVTGIKGIGDTTLYLVVQKPPNEATGVGVLADLKNVNPAEIITAVLNTDLVTKVPLLGNIQVDIVAEGSNKEMITLKDAGLNKLLAKYTDSGKMISKGFRLKCTIPLRKIITKTVKLPTDRNIPEKVILQLIIDNGAVNFVFPEDFSMDLINIAIALAPKLSETAFTKIFDKSPNITISKFDINVKTMNVDVELKTVGEFSLKGGLLKLEDASFKLKHKPEGPWDFDIIGKQTIGDGMMDILINKKGDDFSVNAKITDITTKQLVKTFGGENKIANKISKMDFLNFGIKDFEVKSTFNGKKLKLRLTGNPVLFDWDGLKFEGVIQDIEDKEKNIKRHMALAVVMENIRIRVIIEKILNKKVSKLGWISEARCALLVSNTQEKGLMDFKTLSEKFQLKEGVFFKAEFSPPKECGQDKFCEVLKDKAAADSKFILQGEITTKKIELKAGYQGSMTFGEKVVLEEIMLLVKADLNEGAYIALSGKLRFIEPALTFSATIALTMTGSIEMNLVMGGMWERPFGLPFLAFGNVMLGAAINPAIPLPAFDITGELHFGKIGTSEIIKAKLAAGLDVYDPFASYFHAEIGTFTIRRILKAFNVGLSLPKAIEDSGFPEGVVVAFSGSPTGKSIPHLKLEISPGFKLYGKVNILGLEARCDIAVSIPLSIKVTVELMPIKIAKGALMLTRGRKDQSNGPLVHVGISTTKVEVKVAAYAQVLGIGTEVVIDISNAGFTFFVYGNLFNIIEANVTVKAPYGNGNIAESTYEASACISTSIADITSSTKETITDGAEATEEVTQEAKKEIEDSGSIDDTSGEKLNYWQEKIQKKEDAIKRKAGKLEKIKDYLDDPCAEQCPKVCVGGPSTKKSKKKLFGMSLKKPAWDDCKFKTEDLACITKCKTKKVYLKGKAAKKKVTTEILIASIEIIKKLLELSEALVKQTRIFMEYVEKAGEKVQQAAEAGKKALDAISKYTKENIVDIKHICFNTTLEKVKNACFGFSIDIVVGGKHSMKFDANACFDTSFVQSIAKAIADKVFPGIASIKEKLNKAKGYFKNISKKKEELKEEEKEIEAKQKQMEGDIQEDGDNDEDDEDEDEEEATGSRRSTIEVKPFKVKSKEWAYIFHQAYGDIPTVTFKDDDTLDAFSMRSPWALAEQDSPLTMIKETTDESFENNFKNETRFLDEVFDDQESSGFIVIENGTQKEDIQMSKVNTSSCSPVYSTVAAGLYELINGFKKEMKKFHNHRSQMINRRNQTEAEVRRLSFKGDFNAEEQNLLSDYIKKIKSGNDKWSKIIRSQIHVQEASLFKAFKDQLSQYANQKNVKLADLFKNHKDNVLKRQNIGMQRQVVDSIDQKLRTLLADDNTTILDKQHLVQQLNAEIKNMNNDCF